jgi:hypothetical protein
LLVVVEQEEALPLVDLLEEVEVEREVLCIILHFQ